VASATSIYQSNSAYLTGQIEKQKEYHAQNLQSFNAARAEYLKKASGAAAVKHLKYQSQMLRGQGNTCVTSPRASHLN
jgi:hypothetical protein